MAIDPSAPTVTHAGDLELHVALSCLADKDKDLAADKAVRNWIEERASGLMWRRCRDLALEDVVNAAHATVRSKTRDGTLPIAGDPVGRADRSYVNRIVGSRFQDARRARQRQAGDCAPAKMTLDREFAQRALDQLEGAMAVGDPEFGKAFPDALELLSLAASAVIDGIQALAAHLSVTLDGNRDPTHLRQWVKRVFRLRTALRKGPLRVLSGRSLRDSQKFLIGLDDLKNLLPSTPVPDSPIDLEPDEIDQAIDALRSTGVLRRIAKNAGAQGQSEAEQISHIHEMVRLKLGLTSVDAVLGLTASDAEYVQRRNALYSCHRHVRRRIAKMLAWMQQKSLVSRDDSEKIDGLLGFLLRR